MFREITISVVSGAIGALLMFFGSATSGYFEKYIADTQVQLLSKQIVNEDQYRNVLLDKMAKDENKRFKGEEGEKGEQGIPGPQGVPGKPALMVAVHKDVSFDTLKRFHAGCVNANSLNTISCPSAIQGFCKSIGFVGGFSQQVVFPNVGLVCVGNQQ